DRASGLHAGVDKTRAVRETLDVDAERRGGIGQGIRQARRSRMHAPENLVHAVPPGTGIRIVPRSRPILPCDRLSASSTAGCGLTERPSPDLRLSEEEAMSAEARRMERRG